MIVPQINDNVRKLLLDSQFVEFVLDASDEASGTNPAWVSYAKRLQAKFAKSDIAEAKYILQHLDQDFGFFSDMDVKELRNRIKNYLKDWNSRKNWRLTNFSHLFTCFFLSFSHF